MITTCRILCIPRPGPCWPVLAAEPEFAYPRPAIAETISNIHQARRAILLLSKC